MLTTAGRFERIDQITCDTLNKTYVLPGSGTLPMNRFMRSLQLRVKLRATMPAANPPASVLADGPFSILNKVIVTGYHKLRKQQEEIINLQGADLRELFRYYGGGSFQHFLPTTALNLGVNQTNDIDFIVNVPFTPLWVSAAEEIRWLLDAPNYDSLKLQVQWGDAASIFVPGAGAIVLTAFGSAGGSPTIDVAGEFAISKTMFSGLIPGRVWRYAMPVTAGNIVSGGNGSRLLNIPRGEVIRSIMMKVGVLSTTVNAGNTAFQSLSDTALTNIKIFRGLNTQIRFWNDAVDIRNHASRRLRVVGTPTTGYSLIEFAPSGHLSEALQTAGTIIGATGDVDLFLQADVAAAANQAAMFIIEEHKGQLATVK